MRTDWDKLVYLASGNAKQQASLRLIRAHQLMEPLREYDPIIVGTFPVNIDVPDSDLDKIGIRSRSLNLGTVRRYCEGE
jgi:hypothetical protein